MDLSDDTIERIAEKIFQKLLSRKDLYDKKKYYIYEIQELKITQKKYEEAEEYKNAELIRRKISQLKRKLDSI